jgi:hypothetical protein
VRSHRGACHQPRYWPCEAQPFGAHSRFAANIACDINLETHSPHHRAMHETAESAEVSFNHPAQCDEPARRATAAGRSPGCGVVRAFASDQADAAITLTCERRG